jgi:hypothetical protein
LASINSALLLGSQYYKSAFSALLKSERNGFTDFKAIGIVSDQPELALPLIQALQPSAYVVDLDDPIDVLAVLAMAHSRVLANSTLSIWAGVLSPADSPTVYSEVWDLDRSHGSELCRSFGWIPVNPW